MCPSEGTLSISNGIKKPVRHKHRDYLVKIEGYLKETLKYFGIFFIASQRTLLTDTRQTLLTIPLTISYLYHLLYNTSLEYSYYTTSAVCFFFSFSFFDYTPMYLVNYITERVST